MKSYVKKLVYLFFIVFILIISLQIFQMNNNVVISELAVDDKVVVNICFLVASVAVISLISICVLWLKKNADCELYKKYFLVCLVIGGLYFFLIPLFGGHDEIINIKRVYEITNGNWVTPISSQGQGIYLPISIDTLHEKFHDSTYFEKLEIINLPLNKTQTSFQDDYINASLYAPVQYLPNILGMFLGRLFNLPVFFMLQLSRLCGFLFYLCITTLSIKIIPEKKNLIMMISLMPVMLATAVAISGDVVTHGVIILFVSYIYKMIKEQKKINIKQMGILLSLACVIALCKIIYLPIVLLLLLLPKQCFQNIKEKYIVIAEIIIIAFIISILWFGIANTILVHNFENSEAQKEFILRNPIKYISIIINTIIRKGGEYIIYFATGGNKGCQMPAKIHEGISLSFFIMLIITIFAEEGQTKLNKKGKITVCCIALLLIVLTFTAIYVQWTAKNAQPGNEIVLGMQGKYFIPVSILAVFLIDRKRICVNLEKIVNIYIIMHIPILLQIISEFLV